ncbi:DUF4259 domain-containing protein [Nocardia sp. NPDC127526]|uniref:DUF4259 domain-containing protein n=1 Tax=Nocardia sp. NPDC127526 TaxID=3345393 RepID=UPI00362F87C7
MGTWDVGPFDNDSAADWCGGLHDAAPDKRQLMIREALTVVAGSKDYLDSDVACDAIAAAAIIAAQRTRTAITSSYAPDFLLEGGSVSVDDDVAALAIAALDRIVADESEWRDLWEESESFAAALEVIAELRADLED